MKLSIPEAVPELRGGQLVKLSIPELLLGSPARPMPRRSETTELAHLPCKHNLYCKHEIFWSVVSSIDRKLQILNACDRHPPRTTLQDAAVLAAFGVYPCKHKIHVLNALDVHRLEKEYKIAAQSDIRSPLGKPVIEVKMHDGGFGTLRIQMAAHLRQPHLRPVQAASSATAAQDSLRESFIQRFREQLRIADDGMPYSWDEFKQFFGTTNRFGTNNAKWYWNRATICSESYSLMLLHENRNAAPEAACSGNAASEAACSATERPGGQPAAPDPNRSEGHLAPLRGHA